MERLAKFFRKIAKPADVVASGHQP